MRSAPWPTQWTTLTDGCTESSASRYWPNDCQRRSSDAPMPPGQPSRATSAGRAAVPVPSITEPPRIRSDQAIGSGLDDLDRLHAVALLDAIDVLHAARDLTEDRVVAVEVRRGAVADVELAARG